MSKDIAVICADTHLAPRAWAGRPITGDAYYSFQQIVGAACERELDLIIAGDVLDTRQAGPETVSVLLEGLTRLTVLGRRTFAIQGQHDMNALPWTVVGGAEHLNRVPLTLGGRTFYGLDYQPAGKLQEELDAIPPGVDVLVAHQVWEDFMGLRAGPQGAFADVPRVPLMLTGDFHERKIVRTHGKDGQALTVLSPGSTCLQEISEPSVKCYGVLSDDLRVKWLALDTRTVIRWPDILTPEDLEKFLDEIDQDLGDDAAMASSLPKELRTPLLRVVYTHHQPDVPHRVRRAVGARAHLFFKELAPDRPAPPLQREGRSLTLVGCLPEVVDPRKDKDLYALATRMLTAEDVVGEVNAWVAEMTSEDEEDADEPAEAAAVADPA